MCGFVAVQVSVGLCTGECGFVAVQVSGFVTVQVSGFVAVQVSVGLLLCRYIWV